MAKVVRVAHSLAINVRLPKSAIRNYDPITDTFEIDARRLRRTIRQYRKLPVGEFIKEWHEKSLRILSRQCGTYI
jgi:hypothetical protein